MKIISLITCIVFVIWLLVIDRRLSKTYTIASWIPTIWLLYCASRPLYYWFGSSTLTEDVSISEGSALDRYFLFTLIFLSCIILIKRKINWSKVIQENKMILILFAYLLISIMWSDFMYVSFKRWIKTFGTVIISLLVLTSPSCHDEAESIYRRMVFILIPFSVVLVRYYPHLGVSFGRWSGLPSWTGVSLHKNMLGALCMVSAIFLLLHIVKTWSRQKNTQYSQLILFFFLILMLMIIWLMKGPGISFSATSTVCMLLGWGILYKLLKLENINKLKRLIVVSIIFSGLFYLIVQVFQINVITILADMVGRDPDLTGRDIVWERLWPIAMRNPILGTGFGGFWIEPMWLADNRTINQAHNGYLDIFIMSGAVGLLLFFLYIIASLKKATTLFGYNKYWGSFVITMLLISLFHNFTESSYLMSTMFLWNIIVVNSIALSPNCTSYRT